MIGLAIAPAHNTPGKRDAQEFRHEAAKWAQTFSPVANVVLFDNLQPRGRRRKHVVEALRAREQVDVLALFMHGYKTGLQCGYDLHTVGDLADEIARLGTRTIVLYACDAGRDLDDDRDDDREPGPGGEGGFADALHDVLLLEHGSTARVYAHAVTGHATRCPWVRFFDASTGAGGQWVIEPDSPLWPRWRRALRETDLRFRFATMSQDEIAAELLRS